MGTGPAKGLPAASNRRPWCVSVSGTPASAVPAVERVDHRLTRGEKAGLGIAAVLAVLLGLVLEMGHVEARIAWSAFSEANSTGRSEAAAGFLLAVAFYRSMQILVLGMAIAMIAFSIVLSILQRRDPNGTASSGEVDNPPE